MAQKATKKHEAEKTASRLWLMIPAAAVPILLLALYYISAGRKDIMDWVNTFISAPYRNAAAHVTAFGPLKFFSLVELLVTLLVLWLLYYIVKTVVCLIFRPHKLYIFVYRILTLTIVALYVFAAYSWLWGIGYHSTDLSEKIGFNTAGVTTGQLTNVTERFAQKANELSSMVRRDTNGHFDEDQDYYFEMSKGVYLNIEKQFPELMGTHFAPKPMIYSRLMSAIGFTGVYIALTGETNINVDAPSSLIPSTIAHEMAHQRGVNSEEEANFAGIAACITSNITIYEYSGYLQGLIYLTSALNKADPEAAGRIMSTLNEYVLTDLRDNNDYWEKHQTPAAVTVTAIYDGYLKAYGQELGIESYGACVDMLAIWLGGEGI